MRFPSSSLSFVAVFVLSLAACGADRNDSSSEGASPAVGANGGSSGAAAGAGGVAGSPAQSAIENPSGSCVAPDDGTRRGYSVEGPYTWIPDCQNVLKREYFRVSALSEQDAAILPRPDGDPTLASACDDATDPLHAIVDAHRLCQVAQSEADLAYVNKIPVGDALAVTHFLNSKLRFAASGTDVTPYAIPSDVLDACALHDNPADLASLCQQEEASVDSGDEVGWEFTAAGAALLAPRLNELYGIQ